MDDERINTQWLKSICYWPAKLTSLFEHVLPMEDIFFIYNSTSLEAMIDL